MPRRLWPRHALRLAVAAGVALAAAVGPAAAPVLAASDALEGQSYGAFVDVDSLLGPLSYGPHPIVTLPAGGGQEQDEVLSVDEPGMLSSGVQQVRTEGDGAGTPDGSVNSSARVEHLDVLAGLLTAQQVDSDCVAARSGSIGSVTLTDAVAGGVTLDASPAPNTTLAVEGLGTVTLNRQVVVDEPGVGTRIEVTAIFVQVSDPAVGTGEIIIARSLCGVQHASVLTGPPVAVEDEATTPAGTPVTVAVLDNDSDPDGDALHVGEVTDPANGTVTANDDGTVTYTPDAGYTGSDVFTYTACDPTGLCASAAVSVTVTDTGEPDERDPSPDDPSPDDPSPDDPGSGDPGSGGPSDPSGTGNDAGDASDASREDEDDDSNADPTAGDTEDEGEPPPGLGGPEDPNGPGSDEPRPIRRPPSTSRTAEYDPGPTTTPLAATGIHADVLARTAVALLAAGSALLGRTQPAAPGRPTGRRLSRLQRCLASKSMGLSERIEADLRAAMKAREANAVATLRMVVAAIRNARVEPGRSGDVTDDETVGLLTREAKKRREAAEAYAAVGRQELADKELRELAIIHRYLPEQLSEEEVTALVDEAIVATGAAGPPDLGKVMAAVMPRVRGRADGKVVNAVARRRLGAG